MASGETDMTDGTRPNFYPSHTLHGAVKDFAGEHEMDAADAWLLAGKLLVYLSESEYQPMLTPEMVELIQAARDVSDDELARVEATSEGDEPEDQPPNGDGE